MTVTAAIAVSCVSVIITMLLIANRIGWHLGRIQSTALEHAKSLSAHAARLDLYEARLVAIGGDLQRLIGRMEATQARIERHTGERPGEAFQSRREG